MEKRRKRGRPSVAETMVGDYAETYEKIITNGKKYRSRRSIADTIYVFAAGRMLMETDSEIKDLEIICSEEYQCRSILNQLGRMYQVEGYSKEDVISIAEEAIKSKKAGHSVKDIEQYILNGRLTKEW